MAKRTVLIVDDELTLLRNLRDALRRQGDELEVLTAGRADEALELMQLTEVDLVVTDFRMPGQDGISFIAEISRQYPNTRCILMTAHGDTETKNRSLANGAVSFIEKPFDLDFFLSEVNRHLSPSGFTGRGLVGFSLLDILQLVSMSQQSVTITVHSASAVGTLYIEDGVLVHAETSDGMKAMRAAYEVVSWSDGDIASSRGVSKGLKSTINMPLMNFLMEAAKYQDEVARLKPINDLKDTVKAWAEVPEVVAAAILDARQGTEVYGESGEKGIPRMQMGKAVMAAYTALNDSLAESADPSAVAQFRVSLPSFEILAVSIVEGRFIALAITHGPLPSDATDPVRKALLDKRTSLAASLSEYVQHGPAAEPENPFDSLDPEDVEEALDLSGFGES